MNCANHPQNPAAAYCRTCGKPLCTACTRPVMGVIYCETCLAERMGGSAPPQTAYQQVTDPNVGVRAPAGPNPGLAGVLGAIPFGVGAIYNGQYAKGLVHLGIFIGLVVGLSANIPEYWYPVLGIAMAFFVVYQIVDAVHTARAIQAGQPAPDPLGLGNMFGIGEQASFSRTNMPTGAVVLIVLGVLFLIHNLISLRMGVLGPLVLIALGIWMLASRFAPTGRPNTRLMGPAVLITLGIQFLLENLGVISFGRTFPVLLIVIGVVLAVQRSSMLSGETYTQPPPGAMTSNATEAQPTQPSSSTTEVKNG